MPKVSVVMPAYNAEKYINQAMDSILNQTYKDFEFIIINDGSTDRTREIILEYDDPRIILVENEKNSGIVVTLNRGLEKACGEYIARMDADDISMYNRIEKQVEFLESHSDIAMVGTGICTFGENITSQEHIFTCDSEQLKAELLFHSCIAHPTVMIRRSVLVEKMLHYDEQFVGREDFALWWEIAKVSKIANLSEILLNYRIHGKQISQIKDEKAKNNSWKLLERRMNDIGVNLTEDEKQSLFMYCRNEINLFEYEDCVSFINGLRKIIEQNKQNGFFSSKKLKKVLGLAVTFSYSNGNLSQKKRDKLFFYGIRMRVYSIDMIIKLIYHRVRVLER